MSTPVRTLLLSLALLVGITVIVIVYADAPLDSTPAVSFKVNNVTNYMGKTAIIAVTNRESHGVSLSQWGIELEGPREYHGKTSWPPGTNLAPHTACLVSLDFPIPYWKGPPEGRRWRVVCVARRNTWFHKLRLQATKLPRIGRWINAPPEHLLASELFSP